MYVTTKLLYIIYTLIQIPIFYSFWYYYSTHSEFKCSCKKFKYNFPLAKASASLINFNLSILIISIIKIYKKYIFIPIQPLSLHYLNVFYIYLWSIVHSIAHYFNFGKLKTQPYFSWGVGFTGHFLWIVLLCFPLFSLPIIRHTYFHKFIVSHNIFFITFVSFIYIHQSFCFIKTDSNKCPLPLSWMWITIPFFLYLCEIIYKYTSTISLHEYIFHSPRLLELKLKPSNLSTLQYTGHVIWLCCKNISLFEWHPFAITKYNYSSNTYSIMIKNRGNWTQKLFNQFTYSHHPRLLSHGPFLNFSIKFIKHVQRNPTIFVTSGIGLTTFSPILYKLLTMDLHSHLHLIIIARNPNDVLWMSDVINSLLLYKSPRFTASFYFTDTSLRQIQNFNFNHTLGRPDLHHELFNNSIYNNFSKFQKVYVYHSGNKNVSITLRDICKLKAWYVFQEI